MKQSFELAEQAVYKKMATYACHSNQGANYEGVLEHAKKANDPCGLRAIHEEVADTVSRIGGTDKDKLRPRFAGWRL